MSGPLAARGGALQRRAILYLLVTAAIFLTAPVWAASNISQVKVAGDKGKLVVQLTTDAPSPLKYKAFSLTDPPRLVFDLAETKLDSAVPTAFSVDTNEVTQVRLGQFSLDPDITRVVVDLRDSTTPPWQITPGEITGEILLTVGKGPIKLGPPEVKKVEGAVLVRLAGAGNLTCEVGRLAVPPRVYFDILGASAGEGLTQDCDATPLRQIRIGQQEPVNGQPVARVVIELRRELAHSIYTEGEDLVIALGPQAWALPLPEYRGAGRLRGKTIVVDPGHGGEDIGAPAGYGRPPKGPYEKDIVLDLAKRLAHVLEAEGATVKMTREDDTYIALPERAAIANRLRADALISLHCNSFHKPNTLRGTSVYYDHPHSKEFARLVQNEMIASLGTVDKGIRNANFAVIRRTLGPGILIETAFINHDEDRARLINPNFRERAARAIVKGLTKFFCEESTGRDEKE